MKQTKEEKQDITESLGQGRILSLVFRLTIPAVVAQLVIFLYNIVDRMFVAKIAGSGMDALAALGIVLPITLIIQVCANLVGLGKGVRCQDNFSFSFTQTFVAYKQKSKRYLSYA